MICFQKLFRIVLYLFGYESVSFHAKLHHPQCSRTATKEEVKEKDTSHLL